MFLSFDVGLVGMGCYGVWLWLIFLFVLVDYVGIYVGVRLHW